MEPFDTPLSIIEPDRFDIAAPHDPAHEEEERRRFMTLLTDPKTACATGSGGCVYRVLNTRGETFALKVARPLGAPAPDARREAIQQQTYLEEYRNQLIVSHLKGFPETYGYGTISGAPFILMEWIEGPTLAQARPALAAFSAAHAAATGNGEGADKGGDGSDTAGRTSGSEGLGAVSAAIVAQLGLDIIAVLSRTLTLSSPFVHRDLSPGNIILCTSEHSIAEQAAIPRFDVRLIDFGSASTPRATDDSFTMLSNIWRNGTPAYAAPEMLTNDIVGVEALRRNRAVDVYALCSILYELYAGRGPFAEALELSPSPFRTKMDEEPEVLEARCARDKDLVAVIMSGLALPQPERPSLGELGGRLRAWQLAMTYEEYLASHPEQAEDRGLSEQPGQTGQLGQAGARKQPGHSEQQGRPEPHAPAANEAAPAAGARANTPADDDMLILAGRTQGAPSVGSGARVRLGARHNELDGKPTAADSVAVTSAGSALGERTGTSAFSRRKLLLGAGALALACVGAAAVGTRGFGIIDRMNGIKPSLADYTWDELSELSQRLAEADSDDAAVELAIQHHLLNADDTIPANAVKPLTLSDGTSTGVQLIGLRHDDLADGSGKAGLTFLFASPVACRALNPKPVSTGGWEACEARAWMENELMERLPDDLKRVIRTASKLTNNAGGTKDADSVTKTWDRLWLPSYVEVVSTRSTSSFTSGYTFLADILNAEGKQYQLFRELAVGPRGSNEALRRTFDGADCYWWLRTPSPDVSLESGTVNFNRVGLDGDAFTYACGSSVAEIREEDDAGMAGKNTLMPGFCL